MSRAYSVEYRLHQGGEVKRISFLAANAADAYDKAVYEQIPEKEGEHPYSAWVVSVTYQNGSYKLFNNFEGKPY